jgi:hypothetical protein
MVNGQLYALCCISSYGICHEAFFFLRKRGFLETEKKEKKNFL